MNLHPCPLSSTLCMGMVKEPWPDCIPDIFPSTRVKKPSCLLDSWYISLYIACGRCGQQKTQSVTFSNGLARDTITVYLDGDEVCLALVGNGLGQQGLATTRRTVEQNSLRGSHAKLEELLRMLHRVLQQQRTNSLFATLAWWYRPLIMGRMTLAQQSALSKL